VYRTRNSVCGGIGLSDGLKLEKRALVRIFYTYQSYFGSLSVRYASAPVRKTHDSVCGGIGFSDLRI